MGVGGRKGTKGEGVDCNNTVIKKKKNSKI